MYPLTGKPLIPLQIAMVLWLCSLLSELPAATKACPSSSKTIPPITLKLVASGLEEPVTITHANDASGRLFVLEQRGVIKVIHNNRLLAEDFLDIRMRVVDGGERGLLGLAFHPRFRDNGLFYINYTTEYETEQNETLTSIIAEYRVDQKGRGDISSERILLRVAQPWGNHNGGQLAFGPDGYLYIALGDGGSGDDPANNGQNLKTLLGAILRIDVDRRQGKLPYAIPRDNPFVNRQDARPEIWAWGLRNPWRFSFDRLTSQLYAADVGQDDVEEIDIIEKGKNYGWRIMEGPICTPGVSSTCKKTGLTLPIYSYRHDKGRSVTGGYVYRGRAYPALCGVYIFGDFVSQAIWGLRFENGKVISHRTLFEAKSMLSLAVDYLRGEGLLISTFGEDEAGEIYVASYNNGRIFRIVKP